MFDVSKQMDDVLLKCSDLRGAKVCKYSRSRQEHSNKHLLAKIGADRVENEPLEV